MDDLISRNKLQQNRPEWLNENCVGREEHNKGWNACNEMWLKTIAEQPTVEAVPKTYADQIRWERDVAVGQLNEIGCQFGQNMDEVKKKLEASQWIPCGERLPEERESIFKKAKGTDKWDPEMFESISDDVNVTVEFEDGTRKTMTSYTTDGKWSCEKEYRIKMKVIAWCPLPEPYKGE